MVRKLGQCFSAIDGEVLQPRLGLLPTGTDVCALPVDGDHVLGLSPIALPCNLGWFIDRFLQEFFDVVKGEQGGWGGGDHDNREAPGLFVARFRPGRRRRCR